MASDFFLYIAGITTTTSTTTMKPCIIRLACAIAAVLSLGLLSCSQKEENTPAGGVDSITLNETSATMETGGTLRLTATLTPSTAKATVAWSSSNPSVASVSEGIVTALAEGSTTITASAGGKSAKCAVVVSNKTVKVESITLSKTEVALDVFGNTEITLTATIYPENATNRTVSWSTDNKNVATVDSDGNVTALASGTARIKASASGVSATCVVTVTDRMKSALMNFYDALDGPHWKSNRNWGSDKPISEWDCIWFNSKSQQLHMIFKDNGLKGQIPESIEDLGDWLSDLEIDTEPGLTGTLPESFARLTRLEDFRLLNTGLESLPDVFGDMKELNHVYIQSNKHLTGPIPESIGSSPKMGNITIVNNYFTGPAYGSWVRLGNNFSISNNCLSGKIPQEFLDTKDHLRSFVRNALTQKNGYGFDISDVDIPGMVFWPEGNVKDLDGETFTFADVISKNRYTVYMIWAPWCTFSKSLLPRLKDYYSIYKQDGLEVIATVQLDRKESGAGGLWSDLEGQKKEVEEKGYGVWYNYFYSDYLKDFLMSTPHAEVYDQDGNVLFSSIDYYPDPVRNRFSKVASSDLMPFLESVLGPETPGDVYASTDYSKDGQVLTLQKATVGKGINIVLMGDAYTDRDMGAGGLYETVMKEAMEEFFAIEPYKTFRNRFNVYAVKVVSRNDRIGEGYSTALGTHFGEGTFMAGNDGKCQEYSLKVPGINSLDDLLTIVITNSRRNSGTTAMFAASQSGIAYLTSNGNEPEFFGPTLRHEAGGHGFAFLADEYSSYDEQVPKSVVDNYTKLFNDYGWYSNVDFTDSRDKIHWSAFLSDDRYKDEVGIHEGGALYSRGAYRPSVNSMMNENVEYFNAPSRWAIYKQIMTRSGDSASFDKFLEYDAAIRGKANSAARKPAKRKVEHTAPPVVHL